MENNASGGGFNPTQRARWPAQGGNDSRLDCETTGGHRKKSIAEKQKTD